MRLRNHFNTGIGENLTHRPARETSGVVATSANGGEEFA